MRRKSDYPPPDTNSGIQREQWRDRVNDVVDPLYQVIRIKTGATWATGSFIPHCRVITVLHGLLGPQSGRGGVRMRDESFVGARFEFTTRTLPQLNGDTVTGHFVVIGHGRLADPISALTNADEDWAIGYDEDCLSEKLELGHFLIGHAHGFELMKRWDFLTAGYSNASGATNAPTLYIDSTCRVSGQTSDESVRYFSSSSWMLSTCSVSRTGFGQLLLRPLMVEGGVVNGPGGRPYLVAYGIVRSIESQLDDPSVPNTSHPTGVIAFTDKFRSTLKPYLDGPVDLTRANK